MMDLKRLNEVGLMNGPSLVECSKESSDAELSLAEKVVSFAVVGLGSAGHSRLEAILSDEAERCGFELAGVVSRRGHADYEAIDQFTLDEVERKEDCDAVVICTESTLHMEMVRRFLSAGKHVIVEYPLALSLADAEILFSLAEEKGVTLYVSQIELLSQQYNEFKKEISSLGKLQIGMLYMGRSLGDTDTMGFISFQGISRLSWLVDMFGTLSVSSAQIEYDADDGSHVRLIVQLTTSTGSQITWIEEQGDNVTPRKQVVFKMEHGNVLRLPEWRYEDWWLRDLKLFRRRISGDVTSGVAAEAARHKRHVLDTLRIAEEIQTCCSSVDV